MKRKHKGNKPGDLGSVFLAHVNLTRELNKMPSSQQSNLDNQKKGTVTRQTLRAQHANQTYWNDDYTTHTYTHTLRQAVCVSYTMDSAVYYIHR